ncbi:MAG: hypothetical protein PHU95_03290 [Candidatus Thermoplasmatota archaeon]|nr:hypothetical protein [Candidatus Thermoplasmatota archaeon]MDD5778455.1 hypothetical protein [Candidatus Thermoplasmatota archaeon]
MVASRVVIPVVADAGVPVVKAAIYCVDAIANKVIMVNIVVVRRSFSIDATVVATDVTTGDIVFPGCIDIDAVPKIGAHTSIGLKTAVLNVIFHSAYI